MSDVFLMHSNKLFFIIYPSLISIFKYTKWEGKLVLRLWKFNKNIG